MSTNRTIPFNMKCPTKGGQVDEIEYPARIKVGTHLDGWRAFIVIDTARKHVNHKKTGYRLYGNAKVSASVSLKGLLLKHADYIRPEEITRVLMAWAKLEANVPKHEEPNFIPSKVAHSQDRAFTHIATHKRPCGVNNVHQIYGLFRDGEAMPALFERSAREWSLVAQKMGAQYHLWTPSRLEKLVQEHYPEFWDMYVHARYPIMRCDIGRALILHRYGGLYSDLDVLPNREWYEQVGFAVTRVAKLKNGHPASSIEIEVLIAAPYNPLLLKWVSYMQSKICSFRYKDPTCLSWAWRNRYVLNTT